MNNSGKLIVFFMTLCAFHASAHISLLAPIGGEMVAPGELVEISWEETIEHDLDNFDLYFSANGGNDWQVIEEDIPAGTLSYTWEVPGVETMSAMIRVVQDNITYQDFDSVSGTFTIAQEDDNMNTTLGTTDLSMSSRLSAYPNPFHSEITFIVPQSNFEESVTIDIYNLSGQKVTTLSNDFAGSNSGEIIWKPNNIEPGIYLVYIDKSREQEVLKLIYEP